MVELLRGVRVSVAAVLRSTVRRKTRRKACHLGVRDRSWYHSICRSRLADDGVRSRQTASSEEMPEGSVRPIHWHALTIRTTHRSSPTTAPLKVFISRALVECVDVVSIRPDRGEGAKGWIQLDGVKRSKKIRKQVRCHKSRTLLGPFFGQALQRIGRRRGNHCPAWPSRMRDSLSSCLFIT